MERILILLFVVLISGCATSNKELIKKLRASGEVEVITQYDTVITKEITRDTIFNMDSVFFDKPFIIEREKLRVEIQRIKGDTVRLIATCRPDTVIKVKEVLKLQAVPEFPIRWWEWIVYTFAGLGGVILIAVILRLIRKP